MAELRFNNSKDYFQNLVKEAAGLIKENKLDEAGFKKLESIASNDGTVTVDERRFINGLKNKINVDKVIKGDFDSRHFVFYTENKNETSSYKPDQSLRNPLNDQIRDIGLEKFNLIMSTDTIKPADLKRQILENPVLKNDKALKDSMNILISKLDNNKESFMYINELFSRKPQLSNQELKQVVTQVTNILSTDYDSRIKNKSELAIDALHDIAAPQNIAQSNIGTCAGTSVQIQLALKSPSEYIKMLDSLAQNKPYKTQKGDLIEPNWSFVNDKTNRTISAKIMQNAIMDFADGDYRKYDSAKGDGGLSHKASQDALSSLFNKNLALYDGSYKYSQEQIIDVIKMSKPSYSNPVSMTMFFDSSNRTDAIHTVNVIDINDESLKFINPWGRVETAPLKEIKGRILQASSDESFKSKLEKFDDLEINSRDFKNQIISELNRPDTREKTLYKMATSDKKFNIFLIYAEDIDRKSNPSPEAKKAVLYMLNDLLSGSNFNAKINYNSLVSALNIYDISIDDILKDAKINEPVYQDIINKLKSMSENNNELKGLSNENIA